MTTTSPYEYLVSQAKAELSKHEQLMSRCEMFLKYFDDKITQLSIRYDRAKAARQLRFIPHLKVQVDVHARYYVVLEKYWKKKRDEVEEKEADLKHLKEVDAEWLAKNSNPPAQEDSEDYIM